MTFRNNTHDPSFQPANSSLDSRSSRDEASAGSGPTRKRAATVGLFVVGLLCGALLAVFAHYRSSWEVSNSGPPAIDPIVRARIEGLWAGATAQEEWPAILDRTIAACGGEAKSDELVEIVRLHPRARVEPIWVSALNATVRDDLVLEQPEPPGPVCRLFVLPPDDEPRSIFTRSSKR